MTQGQHIEIRLLSNCSFADALKVWNEGFQGYFVDMTLTLDDYLARFQREGLSPEYSLIALVADRPAGFVLSGLRMNGGEREAWNGGTGVVPEFRRSGVGKALLRATLDLYRELDVDIASLEAISENHNAISLYQQFGYEIVDRLVSLKYQGQIQKQSSTAGRVGSYSVKPAAVVAVSELEFYPRMVPWQAQWQSMANTNGEALTVVDEAGVTVGYALYRRKRDERGTLASIALFQCVADPQRDDQDAIVTAALDYLYSPFDLECRRATYNLGSPSQGADQTLRRWGFAFFVEQVHMVIRLRATN
jgi:ribosomal protein S18 acetylase RimI-like enzyme